MSKQIEHAIKCAENSLNRLISLVSLALGQVQCIKVWCKELEAENEELKAENKKLKGEK